MNMMASRRVALLGLIVLAACVDERVPTTTQPPEEPRQPPQAVGVYRIEVTGLGTSSMTSSISPALPAGGADLALNNAGNGIVFEQVGALAFVEGARGQGGQRYATFTYRVRNSTGAPLNNLTILLVEKPGTIAGTALSTLRRFDGTPANSAVASQIVPTGAVTLGSDHTTMLAPYPDVIQALTEAEVAAITPPGGSGITNIFPVGYVVRHRTSTTSRLLPVAADANQFDGVLSVSFRLPLQSSSSQDVHSFFFEILAVTDTETRLTESMEEAQDSAAVRRLRERATALSATTVTVLNGSTVTDPVIPDYPGQRQICSPRTAGSAASPVTFINNPAAYARILMLRGGESLDGCAAYFRTGTPDRPATNVPFTLHARALDRYGNLKTSAVDTVRIESMSGPPMTGGTGVALASGAASIPVTYSDYGSSLLRAVGRRNEGFQPITVAGVTRNWTAGASTTDWHTNGNWSPAAVPMTLDSVLIPAAAPLDPVLAANVSVAGVTVEDLATISLNAFDLTASGNVATGLNGGITNTTGRLFLTGTARTVQGVLPRVRVSGTYSLTGNITVRAPLQVDGGRLTNASYRIQAASN